MFGLIGTRRNTRSQLPRVTPATSFVVSFAWCQSSRCCFRAGRSAGEPSHRGCRTMQDQATLEEIIASRREASKSQPVATAIDWFTVTIDLPRRFVMHVLGSATRRHLEEASGCTFHTQPYNPADVRRSFAVSGTLLEIERGVRSMLESLETSFDVTSHQLQLHLNVKETATTIGRGGANIRMLHDSLDAALDLITHERVANVEAGSCLTIEGSRSEVVTAVASLLNLWIAPWQNGSPASHPPLSQRAQLDMELDEM
eukprot:4384623-Prymnesium_polylepis.1